MSLLELDPEKRITACEALEHPFFFEDVEDEGTPTKPPILLNN